MALRLTTLVSRFALIFALAAAMPPDQVGLFGLVAASVSYGALLIGLDFYTYSHREMLGSHRDSWWSVLRNHAALTLVTYAAAGPLVWLVFVTGLLPWAVAGWVFCLLILEHAAQEINRLLVVLARPTAASILLFTRSGIWVWPLLFWTVTTGSAQLGAVFAWWTGSVLITVIAGVYLVMDSVPDRRAGNIDWAWIRRGLRVGFSYLFATLCLRGLFTIDRYSVGWFGGLDLVGVYTLYASIAMSVISLVDAGVLAFLYPRVVAASRRRDWVEFTLRMRQMWLRAVAVTLPIVAGCAIVGYPLLALTGKPIYVENVLGYWILLAAALLYAVGLVPHFALYALAEDRVIALSHVAGIVCFAVAAAIFGARWPVVGVAVGLVAALAAILLIKTVQYLRCCRKIASLPARPDVVPVS